MSESIDMASSSNEEERSFVVPEEPLLFPPEVLKPVTPKAVRKRDGTLVPWDETRIYRAVLNAASGCGLSFREAWDMASRFPAVLAGIPLPTEVDVSIGPEGFILQERGEEA